MKLSKKISSLLIFIFFLSFQRLLFSSEFAFMLKDNMKKSNYLFEFSNIIESNYFLINEYEWFGLAYRPSFIFGSIPLGLGFYLPLLINSNLQIRKIDYQDPKSILSKIDFIQYGYPKENPLYIIISSLKDISFQEGFLLRHYQNNLSDSLYRNVGLFSSLKLKGFENENIISNFFSLSVIGTHIKMIPGEFFSLENSLAQSYLNLLQIGFIGLIDIQPEKEFRIQQKNTFDDSLFLYDEDEKNLVSFLSIYTKAPLFVVEKTLELLLTFDYAYSLPNDLGMALNLGLEKNYYPLNSIFLNYKIEFYYLFGSSFLPSYFNLFYESTRFKKKETLLTNKNDWGLSVYLKHFFLYKKIAFEIHYTHIFPYHQNDLYLYLKLYNVLPRLHASFVYSVFNFSSSLSSLVDLKSIKNYIHFEILYGFNKLFRLGFEFKKSISPSIQEEDFLYQRDLIIFRIFSKITF